MVREVGVEPTKSPRSERGAFANLTTPATPGDDGRTRTFVARRQLVYSQPRLPLCHVVELVRVVGFELTSNRLSTCRICQFSYTRIGPSGRIRTDKREGLSFAGRPIPVTLGVFSIVGGRRES